MSIIEDGRCVTARVDFNNANVNFLDVPIGPDSNLSVAGTAEALSAQGLEVIAQEYYLVLPDLFITIDPYISICYWDKNYWTPDGFRDETVEP